MGSTPMDDNIKKTLCSLIASDQFGNGKVTSNAYDTAWAGRLPSKSGNVTEPAFPQCLKYLRKTQHPDGSWGAKHPFLIFDRIISTISAIICLKLWSFDQDKEVIARGQTFINENLKHVKDVRSLREKLTVGFELLLPPLLYGAKDLDMLIDSEDVIEVYRKEREDKVRKIIYCEQVKNELTGKIWYFNLEGLDNLYSLEEIKAMINDNGLISGSYGATVFALLEGIENDTSYEKINNIVEENCGGVPSAVKCDILDLSCSLNNILYSGYSMNSEDLEVHIDKLEKIWTERNGMVGASTTGIAPDSYNISNSLSILTQAGRLGGRTAVDSLLKFFRSSYFVNYEAEQTPSLTTNLQSLIALSLYHSFDDIAQIIDKVLFWTKTRIIDNNYEFADKWHKSRYYVMSKAILAFNKYDPEFSQKISSMLIDEQHRDGGWGIDRLSTKLETAYVVITILYCLRSFDSFLDPKWIDCLKKAKAFMKTKRDEEGYCYWMSKTLYSAVNLDKLTIVCASYSLEKADLS